MDHKGEVGIQTEEEENSEQEKDEGDVYDQWQYREGRG